MLEHLNESFNFFVWIPQKEQSQISFKLSVVFSIYRKSKVQKNGILLLGLCDAGKTLIFARLIFKKYISTHTSTKENMNDYTIGNVSNMLNKLSINFFFFFFIFLYVKFTDFL